MLNFFSRLVLFFSLCFSFTYTSAEALPAAPQMLKKAMECVVNIKTYGIEHQNDTEKKKHFVALGSGVVISAKQGYIVTNAHILEDADKVVVTLKDSQQYMAKIIGTDRDSDIAVLKINAPHLTEMTIANSNTISVGDTVYAIGNPFGLNASVSSGIVSALERDNLNLERYEDFIQIDASINPGNSGGALINTQGQLVGMNTAILTGEDGGGSIGIGFAIPSNMLAAVIPQLIKDGKVERGILGIVAQTMTPTLASAIHTTQEEGAVITSVLPYSPAQEADVCVGDIITQINDVAITTASQVVNTVGFLTTGTKVKLTLFRAGKTLDISVTLMNADKQQEAAQKQTPYLNNVSLQDVSFYSPENGKVNGVLLVEVKRDSAAWIAGLRAGDIILSANGAATPSIEILHAEMTQIKDTLALLVMRDHTSEFIVLTPESAE